MNDEPNQTPNKRGRPSRFATEEEKIAHRKEYQRQYQIEYRKKKKVTQQPIPTPPPQPIPTPPPQPIPTPPPQPIPTPPPQPIPITSPQPIPKSLHMNIGQLIFDQLEWSPHNSFEYATYADITFIRNLEPINNHKPHTLYDIQSLIDQHHHHSPNIIERIKSSTDSSPYTIIQRSSIPLGLYYSRLEEAQCAVRRYIQIQHSGSEFVFARLKTLPLLLHHLMGPLYTTYIEPIFNINHHFLDNLEWSHNPPNIQLNGNHQPFETAIYKDIIYERTDDHQYLNATLILQQFYTHSWTTHNCEVTVQQRGKLWQSFIKEHPTIQLNELKYMIRANIYYIPNKYLPVLLKYCRRYQHDFDFINYFCTTTNGILQPNN